MKSFYVACSLSTFLEGISTLFSTGLWLKNEKKNCTADSYWKNVQPMSGFASYPVFIWVFWSPVVKMDKIENSLEWLKLNHFVHVKFTLEVSILSQKERTNIYISNHNYSPTSSQKKLSIFLARSLTFLSAFRSYCPYHQFKSVHKLHHHHHHHQRWRSWWKEKSNMNSIHVVSFLLWTKKTIIISLTQ